MIIKKLSGSICQDASLLTDGKQYTVYAIMIGEHNQFLLEDEDAFSFPFFISGNEVEVIDSRVSMYWKYSGPLAKEHQCSSRPAMLACEEMLERFFYQKLVDGDIDIKNVWKLMKERLDIEVATSL